MRRIRCFVASTWARPLLVLQLCALPWAPGCIQPGALDPQPGVLEYRAPARVAVAGGEVDVAGGNLVVRRLDLSIDTRVGPVEMGAVYNSTTGVWTWPFDMRYDGDTFVDDTGAVHDLARVAAGAAVPGTHWIKLDAAHVATKGGLVHAFDPVDHGLREIAWGVGSRPALIYHWSEVSGSVRPVRLIQCDGLGTCRSVFDIAYDESGCVSEIADRAGRIARLENDTACRPVVARRGIDVEEGLPGWRYAYDGMGRLVSATSSEGERTAYGYLAGRLISVRQIASTKGEGGVERTRIMRFAYGADPGSGLYTTRVRDPRHAETVYRYDAEGCVRSVTDAVGDERHWSWSARRPVASIDAAGAATYSLYDDDDPVRVTLPSGNRVTIEYAPGAHDPARPLDRPVARVSDSLGLIEQRTYDALGRLERVENGAGESISYVYSGDGALLQVFDAAGVATAFDGHGEHGHPTQVIRATHTDHRIYDAVGNLLAGGDIRDPLAPGRPGVRRLAFDAARRVTAVETVGADALGDFVGTVATVSIERRSDGRIRRIRRPYGGDAEWVYDGFGDLVERRERADGVWHTTRIERDVAGDVVAVELPNGMRRERVLDPLGRVVERRLLRDGVVVQTESSTFEAGRLVRRLDSVHGAPERYLHDAAGRVRTVLHPDGEVTELDLDLRSREVRRTLRPAPGAPPVRTIERVFDGADREIEIRDDGERVLARAFEGGRPARVAYGNGLERTFAYDASSGALTGTRLTNAVTGGRVAETVLGWSVCHGASLCVTSRSEIDRAGAGVPAATTREGYRLGPFGSEPTADGVAGMRIEAWMPDDNVPSLGYTAREFVFDPVGSWLGVTEQDVPRVRAVFNPERNRLLAMEGEASHVWRWDTAGFAIERDGETLTWSPNGRPTSLGADVSLAWEVSGRLVAATVAGVTTRTRFGGLVLADAAGAPLRIDLGEVVIDLARGERFYRLPDFRGNVQHVIDGAGDVVVHRTYMPFGEVARFGDHDDARGFAQGTALGDLLLVGARVYDPAAGRFLSPDPVFHAVNQHAYTLGNPVLLWDPGGTHAEPSDQARAQKWFDVADLLEGLGLVLIGAGIASGQGEIVLLGVASAASSLVVRAHARAVAGGAGRTPVVVIEAVDAVTAEAGSSESTELPGVACAPTAISARRGIPWWSLAVVGGQVGLALALARWPARRRRRR